MTAFRLGVQLSIVFAVVACQSFAGQQQYDSGNPTADEQYVLEVINRARADPAAEGVRIGININEGLPAGQTATAKPPLAMNKLLLSIARAHSLDMYTRKFFGHVNPDNKDPFDRMDDAGYTINAAGENIAAASNNDSDELEDLLMVDAGISGRGHRVNLLNTNPQILFREIGVGYYSGPATVSVKVVGSGQSFMAKNFLSQDFGTNSTGPFVLGVVYTDTNTNNFYDPGEGISGVTVTPDTGNFFAVTGDSGGFAFPTGTSGTVTLTASGGTLMAPMMMQVTLTGSNVKADFVTNAPPATAPTLTSSLAAAGKINMFFTYQATADGTQPIKFSATGLPPGLTLSGSVISGAPTQAGQFMVTLSAMNSKGTDTKTLVLTIAGYTSNSGTDSDGDNFPNELETALGTQTNNAASTPFGGAAAVPLPLTAKTLVIKLNFAKPNLDSITLSGSFNVPVAFDPNGKQVALDVGGVIRTFMLNTKGTGGVTGGDTFKIKVVKGMVPAGLVTFSAKVIKAQLKATLVDEGLENINAAKAMLTVPVIVLVNQNYFSANRAQSYTATKAKSGATK